MTSQNSNISKVTHFSPLFLLMNYSLTKDSSIQSTFQQVSDKSAEVFQPILILQISQASLDFIPT